MTRLAFIGGGGFAKEALEIAELNGHQVVGYVAESRGILDVPYWGGRDELLARRGDYEAVCVAFGATDRRSLLSRGAMVDWLAQNDLPGQALVSPHAVVSKGASIGPGAIVAHRVVVSVDAQVGAFVILNTAAIVGHDAAIGDNVTIAPGAFVGGVVTIGRDSLIGPGATVLQGLKLGEQVVVGVGGSVVRNVADRATVTPLRSKAIG